MIPNKLTGKVSLRPPQGRNDSMLTIFPSTCRALTAGFLSHHVTSKLPVTSAPLSKQIISRHRIITLAVVDTARHAKHVVVCVPRVHTRVTIVQSGEVRKVHPLSQLSVG